MRTLNSTTLINDICVDRNDRRVVIGTVEQHACVSYGARVFAKASAYAKAKPGAESTAHPVLRGDLLGLPCSLHGLVGSQGWHSGRQMMSLASRVR